MGPFAPAPGVCVINSHPPGGSEAERRHAGRSDKHGDKKRNQLTEECQMLCAAKQILERRRLRQREFGSALFGEPAWEMLLELYVRESSGASTTTTQLQAASASPPSTSVRWLQKLQQEGLVNRRSHPVDHGTEFLELTNAARGTLERYLAAVGAL